MNHLGDTNKMVDTPRTDAVWKTTHTMYELAGEMKRIERELNESNQRIKRLEEALTWYESKAEDCNRHGSEGVAARDALANDLGRKAKEAKP